MSSDFPAPPLPAGGAPRLVGALERALYLRTIPGLAGLDAAQISIVARNARERRFRRGQTLLQAGERVGSAYHVVAGRVRARGEGHAGEVVGTGETLGMLSLLARSPHGMEAVAESDVLAIEFEGDAVLDVYEDHFAILGNQLRNLARLTLRLRRRRAAGAWLAPWPEPLAAEGSGLDLVERLFVLRRSPPFRRTSLEGLGELARALRPERHAPGSRLWARGERSGHLLVLVAGSVRCALEDGGEFRCGPGYPLGNLESMAEEPRWYEAAAEGELVALRGEVQDLLDVLEDHFDMAMDLLGGMAAHLIELQSEPPPGAGTPPAP